MPASIPFSTRDGLWLLASLRLAIRDPGPRFWALLHQAGGRFLPLAETEALLADARSAIARIQMGESGVLTWPLPPTTYAWVDAALSRSKREVDGVFLQEATDDGRFAPYGHLQVESLRLRLGALCQPHEADAR